MGRGGFGGGLPIPKRGPGEVDFVIELETIASVKELFGISIEVSAC